MALTYQLIVLLGVSSVLWMGADAWDGHKCKKDCCFVCPDGWITHEGRCFKFFYENKDWSDAEDACIDQGGNLAYLRPQDYDFVKNLAIQLTGEATRCWLGGYDEPKEGAWKWTAGPDFDFDSIFYHPEEPNNWRGVPENCLELFYQDQRFNDAPCNVTKSYICGRPMTV